MKKQKVLKKEKLWDGCRFPPCHDPVDLNKTQAMVYMAIDKLKTTETNAIFYETGIQDTQILNAIHDLRKLGLVEKSESRPTTRNFRRFRG
jgi:hypothetical protein